MGLDKEQKMAPLNSLDVDYLCHLRKFGTSSQKRKDRQNLMCMQGDKFPSKHGIRGKKSKAPSECLLHPLGTREGTGCQSAWTPDSKCGKSVHLNSAEVILTPTCKRTEGIFLVNVSKDRLGFNVLRRHGNNP